MFRVSQTDRSMKMNARLQSHSHHPRQRSEDAALSSAVQLGPLRDLEVTVICEDEGRAARALRGPCAMVLAVSQEMHEGGFAEVRRTKASAVGIGSL